MITPIVTATDTTTLLSISRPRSPIRHAARKVSSVRSIGSNDFGWSIASGPLFSACIKRRVDREQHEEADEDQQRVAPDLAGAVQRLGGAGAGC